MGILNSHQKFFIPALTPAMYRLGMIFGVLFLTPKMGIYGLAWGVMIGACLHLLLQVPSLIGLKGSYIPTLGLQMADVRQVALLMAPRVFGAAVVQLNFWVNTNLASRMAEGSVTAITWAFTIMLLPQAIIAQSVATAALPTLSGQYALGRLDDLRSSLAASLRGILLLAIPIVMAIGWLSRRLTAPVKSLTQVVSNIPSSGDLSSRAEVVSHDELGTLAATFNNMAENLQHSSQERERFVAELELLTKTLELRVQERTQALESANQDLTGAITRLKAAQGQLVHSEKMASLGQLVAGVAHELNNPIGFIYANFPHLEDYTNDLIALIEAFRALPLDDALKADIEKKIRAIDLDFIQEDILKIIRSGKSGASRIKEIVSSLRSFSRLDEAELKSVLLEDGINDTLAILNHHIKNRIEVVRDFQLNQPVVCRAGQINQVFMNIIYNAIQAMDQKGTLRVPTRRMDNLAVVRISDTGKGIPPDVIGKIFDPFFSTKKVGEGTGLGLSISYGIIEQHGGHLEVASEVGKGTEFTIRIPLQAVSRKEEE